MYSLILNIFKNIVVYCLTVKVVRFIILNDNQAAEVEQKPKS